MMDKFQVTAKFGNIFEVVGHDVVDETEAQRLFDRMINAGREVRLHKIVGDGSRLVKEHNP